MDEDGAVGVRRDRQLQREVVPGASGGTPIDPQGQESTIDAECLERQTFSGAVGNHGKRAYSST